MDDNVLESRHAATQLSLADLRDLQAVPFTSSEDEQLAHTLWREELEHFASTLADRQLVQDSQTALRIGQTLDTVRTQREQRSARLALAAHPYRRNSPNSATSASTVPSASTSGDVGLNLKTSRETSACVSCTEEVGAVAARANCGPLFSAPCLIRLFRLATRGECLFPPSCCTMPIPDALALPLLDDGDAKDYRQASEEFCSPKRLYCSNGKCGRWLGPLTALKRDVVCCNMMLKSLAQMTTTETLPSNSLPKSMAADLRIPTPG
ncbi:IBR domain-containing protein [Rhodotorula toruloides]|uniref:IBR domain-containing protein n=1 Tax=Rhodotorula toruloides TaxID=5286 RepID=A0A511KKF2_RHOTO|nr:IBR domain-containing protein [Rhodotorula toruloides]